jgi:hypothetical protein
VPQGALGHEVKDSETGDNDHDDQHVDAVSAASIERQRVGKRPSYFSLPLFASKAGKSSSVPI